MLYNLWTPKMFTALREHTVWYPNIGARRARALRYLGWRMDRDHCSFPYCGRLAVKKEPNKHGKLYRRCIFPEHTPQAIEAAINRCSSD